MTVESKVQAFVEKSFLSEKQKSVGPNDSLLDSGLIDSTGIFELVSFLEDEFGIQIQDEEIVPEHFETVTNIAAFVASKRTGAGSR